MPPPVALLGAGIIKNLIQERRLFDEVLLEINLLDPVTKLRSYFARFSFCYFPA